jgi:hypothetical protein
LLIVGGDIRLLWTAITRGTSPWKWNTSLSYLQYIHIINIHNKKLKTRQKIKNQWQQYLLCSQLFANYDIVCYCKIKNTPTIAM